LYNNLNLMSKLFKKTLLSFLASFVLILGFVPVAFAQTQGSTTSSNTSTPASPGPWYNQNFGQFGAKVFGGDQSEIFGERYTYAQVNWIINSLTAIIIGPKLTTCISTNTSGDMATCLNSLKAGAGLGMSNGAIVGIASLANTLLNMRPASGVGYIKDTATKLNIIPKANAQSTGTGAGFVTLQPIVSLWSILRDISYTLLIFVIIIMAFMIMFRVKISPQVVISVQSALPKIAMTLILITFSYAIAGFLVDMSYVFLGTFAVAIKGIGGERIVTNGILGACGQNGSVCLFNQLNSGNGLVSIFIGLIITAWLAMGAGVVGLSVSGPFIPIVGGVMGVVGIITLILAIIVLIIILRLLWLIIRTACLTVLLVTVGPIMILMGTFSSSGGFGRWFRLLAANLAVYPTISIMIFLSHYFFWGWFMAGSVGNGLGGVFNFLNTYQINNPTNAGATLIPGLPGNVNLPGVSISTNLIGLFLAFVILFLIPRTAHVIEAMIEGKGFDYGSAIGEAARPITGPAGFVRGAILGGVGTYIGTQVRGRIENRFGAATATETTTGGAISRAGTPPKI
jgi:hypothetical protein